MLFKTKPLKILLVEDDQIVLLVYRKMLANMGYRPDTAENGQQALAMAANGYDVIFMDIGLPDISGIEVAAEIRRHEGNQKRARLIAFTGYPLEEIQHKCLAVGMDEVALKPIKAEVLQQVLGVSNEENSPKGMTGSSCNQLKAKTGCFGRQGNKFYLGRELGNEYFTQQQLKIFKYLILGWNTEQIATRIYRSPKTVEHHIERIKEKLQCSAKSQIAPRAIALGLTCLLEY